MTIEFQIVPELPEHEASREALLDRVIGPIRFRRASERLREKRMPAPGLAFVALANGRVAGTVRLWPVHAAGLDGGLLLGPLAVDSHLQRQGIGTKLVPHTIATAAALNHRAILLVGDAEYYSRFGFSAAVANRLAVPGPFERHRLLGLALDDAAFELAHGTLRPNGVRLVDSAISALARIA